MDPYPEASSHAPGVPILGHPFEISFAELVLPPDLQFVT